MEAPFFIHAGKENHSMAITLELEGLKNANDVNALTTALISLDGVENVEVALHWAEVEGCVARRAVEDAVRKAGFRIKS